MAGRILLIARAAGVLAVLALAAACNPSAGAFLCFSDEECKHAGQSGTCQQSGYCSFDDPGCSSGQRYGDYAGDNLAGRCVPGAGDGSDAGDEPDGAPPPACGALGGTCCAATPPTCEPTLTCTNALCGCATIGLPASGVYSHHSCALQGDGSAWCWGSDAQGQIGAGTTRVIYKKPKVVADLAAVTRITTGANHTCAVAGDEVYCWGDNEAGQTGNPGNDQSRPRKVGLGGVTSIDTGGSTTCTVSAGQVHCWGRNQFGQVGDGTDNDRNKPRLVEGIADAVAVTAGVNMTCALLADHTARCWGAGGEGELGDGLGVDSKLPVQVSLSQIAQISAGDDQTCALTDAGAVYCWGDNEFGSLGDGTKQKRLLPTPVVGLEAGVAEIDVADEFACARRSDGSVWCWGANDVGQLGRGTTSIAEPLAAPVDGLADATAIAAGADHVCVRRVPGVIACWGANIDGQIGDGTTAPRLAPTPAQLPCP